MANKNLFNTVANVNTVIVHGGLFHLDDVLLVALVKKAFPDVTVVRNNKPDLTTAGPDTGVIIADVGGKFDPDHWIFDHHHLKFDIGDDNATAAVGLLWNTLGNKDTFPGLTALIHAVDLHDTGATWNAALASLGAFAPNWDDPTITLDAAFDAAVAWVSILLDAVIKKDLAALKAVDLLDALPIDDGILILPKFIPWADWAKDKDDIKVVVFPGRDPNTWNVNIPKGQGTFPDWDTLPAGVTFVTPWKTMAVTTASADGTPDLTVIKVITNAIVK